MDRIVAINFQPATSATVAGYATDSFEAFGPKAGDFKFGWVTEASALDADGTSAVPIDPAGYPSIAVVARSGTPFDGYDPRLTTYAHTDLPGYSERAAWEIAVADGFYAVKVAVGDTGGPLDSVYDLEVEGRTASDFTPTPGFRTELAQVIVEVTDGFLTLAAPDGAITELQYLEIDRIADLTPGDGRDAPLDYPSFSDLRAAAQDGAQVFETALDPATGFADGVDPAADIFLGVATAPGRTGIALQSLGDGSIRLYETLTGAEVAYSANTTAGADSVTISPDADLKPNTSYTLVVEGAVDRGPNDGGGGAGREFLPVATTFATGDARADAVGSVAFNDTLELSGSAQGGFGFTSVEIAPDGGHLYVSTIAGEIKRWALDPVTGALDDASVEVFAPGGDFDTAGGRRGIIGLAVDPTDPDVLWISDNWPVPLEGRDDGVPEFSGRISKVQLGPDGSLAGASVEPYITGLPRSNGDHVVNGLEFRVNPNAGQPGEPGHLLYTNVGSNTAMGAPDSAWGLRPERLLSAATLEIDPSRVAPPGGFDVTSEPIPQDGLNRRFADSDGDLKNGGIAIDSGPFSGQFLHFDASGVASVRAGADASSAEVQAFYDPFAADAVVKVFATGGRNPYDLVWHSNGSLYVPTNGSAAGGSTPDDPSTAADEGLTGVSIQPDYLFRMEEGGYYGHPNPLHDRFVLNGGNPTAGLDPNEVADYAPGTLPDPDYDIDDAYSLGFSRSPNGAVEYTSDAWGDALQGALLFTEYSGGNDIRAVTLDADGDVDRDFVLRDFDGALIDDYVDPLDITINPATGQLYMVTLNRATGSSQIVRLDPSPPPVRVEAEDMTVASGFAIAGNGSASGGQQLQATGSGPQEASFVWTGPAGLYTVSIGHFDEDDGVSQLATRVDGRLVDAFYWDRGTGGSLGNAASFAQENLPGIQLEAGSVVSFEGFAGAGEPLRFDYVDLAFTGLSDEAGPAPANAAPASVSVQTGDTFAFDGADAVSVSDADSGVVTVTLGVGAGTLSLSPGSGADVFGAGTGEVVVSGEVADVSAALATLAYTPTAGFFGTDSLSILTDDGASSDVDTVAIDVQPFGDADADIVVQSLDPAFLSNRLHFSYIDDPDTVASSPRSFKDEATVRLENVGTADLDVLGATLDGPFVLADPTQLDGLTIAPNTSVDVTVRFDRTLFDQRQNAESSVFTGALTLETNDLEDNVVTVDLAGSWQRIDEGSWEPNINEIWEVFGFGNRIAGLPFVDSDPSPLDQLGLYQAYDENEILSPYWRIADGVDEARITHIAQYASPGGASVAIHRPYDRRAEAVTLDSENSDTQRLLPEIRSAGSSGGTGSVIDGTFSSATFTNATIPGNWQGDDLFGIDIANFSSDPSLNPGGTVPSNTQPEAVDGHWTRIFQALDADGAVIANTYLGVQDFSGSNGDYNDNLVVLEGIAPASNAPEVVAPQSVIVAEDGSFAFDGANAVTVTDVDGDGMTREFNVVVRASNGTLSATAVAPTTVGGNGTDVLVIDGDRDDIQETLDTLASLVYTPDPDFVGSDEILVTANDRVLSGTGTIAVTVVDGDDDAPVATAVVAADVTEAGGTGTAVVVTYADDVSIDAASFGTDDIVVRGPSGETLTVTGATVSTDGPDGATVTYAVQAAGGTWDGLDNGTYAIDLAPGAVLDGNGNASLGATGIGTFDVDVAVGEPVRIEAEALTVSSGFAVQGNGSASGGQILQAGGSSEQRAGFVFGEPDGTYRVTIGHFDENDGQSTMRLLVNGFEVDAFTWDRDAGTALGNGPSLAQTVTDGVTLQAGDLVEIAGLANGGEPLRTDYLDFLRVAPIGADDVAPTVLSVSAPDVTFDDAGTAKVEITVTYGDDRGIDAGSIDVGDIVVTGPDGAPLSVTQAMTDPSADGLSQTAIYTVAAPGGDWDLDDDGTYAVALAADEVRDAAGNSVAGTQSLAAFEVAVGDVPVPDPFRIEAEAFTELSGFGVQSNGAASGGAYLQAGGGGVQSAATTFAAAGGVYNLDISYFDENDGQSTLALRVNGVEVDRFVWDLDAGGALANGDSLAVHTVSGVTLRAGDEIELVGTADGGEPLRTDAIDFTFVAPAGADETPPFVQAATAPDLDFTADGTATVDVDVTFADNVAVDVSSIDVGDITVTGPSGPLTVTAATVSQAGDGSPLGVTYTVAAPGGTWDAGDDGAYVVALAAGEILDTAGNPAGAAGIASFDVAVADVPAPDPFRVEAEAFTPLAGFGVSGNGAASGGQVLQSAQAGPKEARYVFDAPDGVYDIGIGHFDETDGQSSLGLFVNGISVEDWVWDIDAGSALGNAAAFVERSVTGVTLRDGDVIELRGAADGGEPLRVDYLDFAFAQALDGDAVAPVVLDATAPDIAFAQAGTATTTIAVTYGDDVAVDLTTVDVTDIVVTGPDGAPLTVSAATPRDPSDGSPRTVDYVVEAPGGTWDAADDGVYDVALVAEAVADASGNAVTSDAALATFAVAAGDVPPPDPFRVEAEALSLVQGFEAKSSGIASGGQYLQANGSGLQRATFAFDETAGNYTIGIGHYDEADGQSTLSLLVNGDAVDTFVWDTDPGGVLAQPSNRLDYEVTGVALQSGDVVEIAGTPNGGEPLRIDYIDFTFEMLAF